MHNQRVHGVIPSVGPGRRLIPITDDGRTVRVDLSRNDIDLRLLTRGEGVTVVGRTGGEFGAFAARNVVVDPAPSALPRWR